MAAFTFAMAVTALEMGIGTAKSVLALLSYLSGDDSTAAQGLEAAIKKTEDFIAGIKDVIAQLRTGKLTAADMPDPLTDEEIDQAIDEQGKDAE